VLAGVRDYDGNILSNGTFSCVTILAKQLDSWCDTVSDIQQSVAPARASSGTVTAAISIICGFVGLVVHQYCTFSGNCNLSTWALLESRQMFPQKRVSISRHSVRRSLTGLFGSTARWWRILHYFFMALYFCVDTACALSIHVEMERAGAFLQPYKYNGLPMNIYMVVATISKALILSGWNRAAWLQVIAHVCPARLLLHAALLLPLVLR
jgi:hypothetical protein